MGYDVVMSKSAATLVKTSTAMETGTGSYDGEQVQNMPIT